jgi:hypothetical protein
VTVNHDVVGSSPTGGAIPIPISFGMGFCFLLIYGEIYAQVRMFFEYFQKKFFEKNPLDKTAYYLLKYTPGDKKVSFSQLPFLLPKIFHPPVTVHFFVQ